MMLTPEELERRRLIIATFEQSRAGTYARFADLYRTRYLKIGWRRWFAAFDQRWVLEKINEWQALSSAHAYAARLLMGIE